MNMLRQARGFTLVELLVVIAIIGILAAVVLASLSNARSKGGDTAVKSNLKNAQAQAELYYSINDTYVGLCADPVILRQLNAAMDAGKATSVNTGYGNNTDPTRVTCRVPGVAHITAGTAPDSYMFVAPLDSSSANAWCVDSNGNSKEVVNNYTAMNSPSTGTTCP